MKKLILALILLPLSIFAQDNDTIYTMNSALMHCHMYAIDGTHLRYNQKGVGKIISIDDILTCSSPWKHKIDSINKAQNIVASVNGPLKKMLLNACKDTAKTLNILAVEMGKLTVWNISYIHVLVDIFEKTESGALLLTLDYGQDMPTSLLTKAQIIVPDNNGAYISNSMIAGIKFLIAQGWIPRKIDLNKEDAGEQVYNITMVRH